MVEVKWLPKALDDIDRIAEYISKDSERYAEKLVRRIFERAELLESNPFLGRMVPEFRKKNLRELIIENYRLVYLVYHERVTLSEFIIQKEKCQEKIYLNS